MIDTGTIATLSRRVAKRLRKPPVGWVRFGSLRRTEPVSRLYGWDRGRPIDRYYIETFLTAHGSLITGAVLEIGERVYTERFGRGVTRADMLHVDQVDGATYVADLTDAAVVPSDSYDCVILTQTLHLIFDMSAALQTIRRILKPGGVLLCTVPGISQVADGDWNKTWYWSLTPRAAERLLSAHFPPEAIDVQAFGNVLSATAFLQGLADRELRPKELAVADPEYPVIVTVVARKDDVAQ
ncbi:hypothetical protein MLP_27070 [Microlunatus phosphovorus NM-1]|uniref:Methyltransferase type 11 domain-containing protein n=1 Tax=Microlunatus phosphovorus (strain ATCC 700054 / DSM 10555 / JCM 9379 / NBRC 101784 / NCIMB 13414 / VKM Ac-1990 / NM-1) TaxID=1032480 RepID=F5XI52_MICPN|nr:methyltransferase domain-containing protein [Microlunatus phosphovorus]BAK35721.1 hypothetical protein MLP_27070 [Microlunatus phosphovorus NM-1]